MAEEQEATPAARSPLVGYLIMGAMVVVVPLVLAAGAFNFVVLPMMSPPGEEAAHAEEAHDEHAEDAIPEHATLVEFPETQSSVLSDDPDLAAPVLIYKVAMLVDTPETAALISGGGGDGHGGGGHGASKQVFFTAMLDKLHRNRTRSELSDPQVQETILKRAQQEANNLLKRLAHDGLPHEVLEVMYVKWSLIDI